MKYEGNDEYIDLPEEVEVIADYAFYNAKSLKGITFGSKVREMGQNVFYNCESLEEIELPDSIYFMDSAVFSRCSHLKRVKLSNALSVLPKITFFQCEALEEVELPVRLVRMERACFEQCHSLKHLDLPATLKVMEDNVFDDCTALEEMDLPEGMMQIGNNTFFNCSSMRRINLPASLKSMGKGALETRGRISITGNDTFFVKAEMLDNNWNMYWNFGANNRWNGKNEENYQLYDCYLPCVDLKLWKPTAQCVLAVNYLETYRISVENYDMWIREHIQELMEKMVSDHRYRALNQALDLSLLAGSDVEPYLDRINDREERAKLLNRRNTSDLDDLFDLL